MKTSPLFLGGALVWALASCSSPTSSDNTIRQSVSLQTGDGTYSWGGSPESNLDQERKVSVGVNVPGGASVYYLLTNTSSSASYRPSLSAQVAEGTGRSAATEASLAAEPGTAGFVRKELSQIRDVNFQVRSSTGMSRGVSGSVSAAASSPAPPTYIQDTSTWGFIDSLDSIPSGYSHTHPTTLRKLQSTNDGRHLLIWVADDCWSPPTGTTGSAHKVTQTMVDALALQFLKGGTATDDIYHWVTGLVGPEWPASGAPSGQDGVMVDGGGQIHIFVVNLNPSGTLNGVLMGYYHNLNNYLSTVSGAAGSNEKILFAVDADSLANPSDTKTPDNASPWAITDFWPSEIVSTLAHEFQHMIQFYQKQVVHGLGATDTWINEMASMLVEDLVSDKLHTLGPRGVGGATFDYSAGPSLNTLGRLPIFDRRHDATPLTYWPPSSSNPLPNYSNAYAFGAWLIRNYGGPRVLNDLVTNQYTDTQAVVHAVQTDGSGAGQTYISLVRDWGLAVFLRNGSDRAGLRYTSNSAAPGAFTWTYNSPYSVGSIDLSRYRMMDENGSAYNFSDNTPAYGPLVYNGVSSGMQVAAGATLMAYITSLTGSFSQTVTLPPYVALTVVVGP